MGLLYLAGFQVGGTNTMTVTINASPATIGEGYYLPGTLYDTNNVVTASGESYAGNQYTSFASAVSAALSAALGAAVTVSWSATTGKYTVASAGTFSLTFTAASGLRLRAALGFTGDKSGTNSYESDSLPTYAMLSSVSGRTDVRGPMESDDIAEESVSDGGDPFVVTKKREEVLFSWVQQAEPVASVRSFAINSSVSLWTWQDWFRATRGTHPFVVNDGLEGETEGCLYRLTSSGASFRPTKMVSDDDTWWTVPFEARFLGVFA